MEFYSYKLLSRTPWFKLHRQFCNIQYAMIKLSIFTADISKHPDGHDLYRWVGISALEKTILSWHVPVEYYEIMFHGTTRLASWRTLGARRLVLPVRGGGQVAGGEAEVAVLGGGEVVRGVGGADGEARGLAQLQVEGLRRVAVARNALAVRVPVLAVLTWNVGRRC